MDSKTLNKHIYTHLCGVHYFSQKWKYGLSIPCDFCREEMHYSNQWKTRSQLYSLFNFETLINLIEKIKEGKKTNSPAHRIVLLRRNSCIISLLSSGMSERKDHNPPEKENWNTEWMTSFFAISNIQYKFPCNFKYIYIYIYELLSQKDRCHKPVGLSPGPPHKNNSCQR